MSVVDIILSDWRLLAIVIAVLALAALAGATSTNRARAVGLGLVLGLPAFSAVLGLTGFAGERVTLAAAMSGLSMAIAGLAFGIRQRVVRARAARSASDREDA